MLLTIKNLDKDRRYIVAAAICYSALLYSHLPVALLMSPIVLVYVCLNFGVIKGLQKTAFIVFLGLGLASVYMLPALTTQEFISLEYWAIFNPVDWLWFSGKYVQSKGLFVNFPIVISLVIIIVSLVISFVTLSKKEIRQNSLLQLVLASLVMCSFLLSDLSQPLWQHISILKKVQFPWRVAAILDISVIIIFVLAIEALKAKTIWVRTYVSIVFLLIAAQITLYSVSLRAMLIPDHSTAIQGLVLEGYEPSEYRTKWLVAQSPNLKHSDLEKAMKESPALSIVEGKGRVINQHIKGSKFRFELEAQTDTKIRMRRFFYPGWHLVNTENSDIEHPIALSPHYALIEASLKAGKYSLELVRKPLYQEKLGLLITLLSALFCGFIFFYKQAAGVLRKTGLFH